MRPSKVLAGVALVLLATGCGRLVPKPVDERTADRRSGIFSGESGTFVWQGGRRPADERHTPDAGPEDDDQTASDQGPDDQPGEAATDTAPDP